ncbi:MAG: M48 family metallopeptidase [Candidatus Doudnabacteria bacterium]|nr:M48 family metallopeptidase [Candidatus Doudnabacteria bacterium]
METQNISNNQNIPYKVRLSRRARRLRISVGCENGVVVTLPWGFNPAWADKFVREKRRWILKSLDYMKRFAGRTPLRATRREYLARKGEALALARNKVLQWNGIYGFNYRRISVKNQKTRWGSCSKKGNLNFNYKIIHLPEPLVDYLVVHELCHLREMNHSRNFWELVARAIPNYKILRRELKKFGTTA